MQPYLRLYVRTHAEPEIVGHEHELILEAIRSGSGKRAETVMRAHVMANARGIADCLRTGRTDGVGAVRGAAPKKPTVAKPKARRKSAA